MDEDCEDTGNITESRYWYLDTSDTILYLKFRYQYPVSIIQYHPLKPSNQ